ncbi:MAG: DUF6089 family protein, partial [Fluviicola sp.]
MRHVLLVIALLNLLFASAQGSSRHNIWSRSELGLMGGASYYVGDLNYKHFNNLHGAAQLFYRYNIHSRLAYRLNFTYAKVSAADAESNKSFYVNRNLSFETPIYELGTGIEFTYLPFELGNNKYWGSAYLLAELGLSRINPTTEYEGDEVELQPLGTEGQGTTLSSKNKYSRTQLVVPLAVGCRITLTENIGLNVEYGIRFLFTDYLDDVGGYRYVDPAVLAAENGPLAASLSNRSLDGNRFGQRGNSATRDWYTFMGIG